MNWFLQALKKYGVFTGRARRKEYWYFALFLLIIDVMLIWISLSSNTPIFPTLFGLAIIVPCIAVGVRRMHDVNKSGWFILIPIYSLILSCTPGTVGPNRYGPDLKRPEFEDFLNEPELPAV